LGLLARPAAADTYHLLSPTASGVTTNSGQRLVSTSTANSGFTPTRTINATPSYWYSAPISGAFPAGAWNLIIWSGAPGCSSSITAEIGTSNADGSGYSLLDTQTVDFNQPGNHPNTFNFNIPFLNLSGKLLRVTLTRSSGCDSLIAYNAGVDFDSRLITTSLGPNGSPTVSPTFTRSPTPTSTPIPPLNKSVNRSSAGPGDTLTFTLSYQNPNPATGANCGDDFENGTTGWPSGWSAPTGGNWGLAGGNGPSAGGSQLLDAQTTGGFMFTTIQCAGQVTDGSLQVDAKILTTGGEMTLLWRQNGSSTYQFHLTQGSSANLSLRVITNGAFNEIAVASAPINTGQWYTLKLAVSGFNLQGWVNGVQLISATDPNTTYSAGAAGIEIDDAPAAGMHAQFDNVVVSKAPLAWHGVSIIDTLPAGLSYVSSTCGGSTTGQVVTMPLGDLAAGASGSCKIVAVVNTCPASLDNRADFLVALPQMGFTSNTVNTGVSCTTPTFTRTATASATPTATRSTTPTQTASPTQTSSATRTGTASATPSATASETPSATRTVTATATESATKTPSPTVTASATASASQTQSPSATQTGTRTATLTATASATESATATCSPTRTESPTATATFTASPTDTDGPSATPTDSPTASPSRTATPTRTGTRTATATASASASSTSSPTATPSQSPPPTATRTATVTRTATGSPTPTASTTATGSPSASPSFTPSPSFSASPTKSPTPVPMPIQLRLCIYNAAGERVRTLFQGPSAVDGSGLHWDNSAFVPGQALVSLLVPGPGGNLVLATWDGLNDQGQAVGSGTYTAVASATDPFGQTSTNSASVQALAAPAPEAAAIDIFNSAGERVATLVLPPTGSVSDLRAVGKAFAPGPGSGLVLQYLDGQGQAQSVSWNGRGDGGLALQSGSYWAKSRGQNGSVVTGLVLLEGPDAPLEAPNVGPSPARSRDGAWTVRCPGAPGPWSAELYTLDGGRVQDAQGLGAELRLPLQGLGEGIYLIVVRCLDADGHEHRWRLKTALVP
jgi:hypothetical protein